MIAFLDTSALIKLYHEEEHTSDLLSIISNNIDDIYISDIAVIEFRSAIWKKVREKEISAEIAKKLINLFLDNQSLFNKINLNEELISKASDLIMKYGEEGLRTLDSIQLASSIILEGKNNISITYDKLLRSFMVKEGLNIEQ